MDEEWTAFVTNAEVAALVRQEKEKMSLPIICLSLRKGLYRNETLSSGIYNAQLLEV